MRQSLLWYWVDVVEVFKKEYGNKCSKEIIIPKIKIKVDIKRSSIGCDTLMIDNLIVKQNNLYYFTYNY